MRKKVKCMPNTNTILQSLDSISSILSTLQNEPLDVPTNNFNIQQQLDTDTVIDFRSVNDQKPKQPNFPPTSEVGDDASSFIQRCMKENRLHILDKYLNDFYFKLQRSIQPKGDDDRSIINDALNISIELLSIYLTLSSDHVGHMILHYWIPRLTYIDGNEELWKLLFRKASSTSSSAVELELQKQQQMKYHTILIACMSTWTTSHIQQCQKWLISKGNTDMDHSLDYNHIALFLIMTSGQSTTLEKFTSSSVTDPLLLVSSSYTNQPNTMKKFDCNWANTKDFVIMASTIAVYSFRQISQELSSSYHHRTTAAMMFQRRTSVPSGLTLCTILSKGGKSQLRSVCDVFLKELNATATSVGKEEPLSTSFTVLHSILDVVLLRLYLLFPNHMDVGSSIVRTVLMRSSIQNQYIWDANFVCSFDDRFNTLIISCCSAVGLESNNGASSTNATAIRALLDMARKQPLLILRKLPSLTALLHSNAEGYNSSSNVNTNKWYIPNDMISTTALVLNGQQPIKINICHWGYTFSESLWITILDIIMSIPKEVLYFCGMEHVSLLKCIELYVELIWIVTTTYNDYNKPTKKGTTKNSKNDPKRTVPNEVTRLKEKFIVFVRNLEQCNPPQYQKWISSLLLSSNPHGAAAIKATTTATIRTMLQQCELHTVNQ